MHSLRWIDLLMIDHIKQLAFVSWGGEEWMPPFFPTSFRGETSGGFAKCRLFSQAKNQHVFLQKSDMRLLKIFR